MATIAERVKLSPNITDRAPTYLDEVVTQVTEWLKGALNRPEGFVKAVGLSRSGSGASKDIEALAKTSLRVSVNGLAWAEITLTLSGLTTGDLIAAELQTKIRAVSDADGWFASVTVAFDDAEAIDQYTITSAETGPESAINVSWLAGEQHVARALKLSQTYGGDECVGAFEHGGAQSLAVKIAQRWFRQAEIEGFSDRIPSEAELVQLGQMNADIRKGIEDLRRL